MKVDSLDELKAAFDGWRRKKRHAREAVPEELLERAHRAIGVHGLGSVARATKTDRGRLLLGGHARSSRRRRAPAGAVPSFTRLELVAPSATSPLIAEVETPAGVTLRIFTQTQETLGLLSSLCGIGGDR
jgi:hypothetical protein